MRIEIDIDVANDPEAQKWLERIFHKIDDGWHVWDTRTLSDPNKFKETTWFREERNNRELLEAAVERDVWSSSALHGRRVRITLNPSSEDELSPEAAARFAEEPVCILVENRYSDGAFVKRVIKELDKSLHDLWKRPGHPIRLDSLGGSGEMAKAVSNKTQDQPVRPRLVAIIDSDRKHPKGEESQAAAKLRGVCEKQNVPCWVLKKREAENYLPRTLLLGCSREKNLDPRVFEAWDRLTEDQKDYFNVRHGFSKELDSELLDGLPADARDILKQRGFGEAVRDCWCKSPEKNIRDELLDRSRGDLEHGIDLIHKGI